MGGAKRLLQVRRQDLVRWPMGLGARDRRREEQTRGEKHEKEPVGWHVRPLPVPEAGRWR